MKESIQTYLEYRKVKKKISLNTWLSYERDLRGFAEYLEKLGIFRVSQINQTNILAYVYQLEKAGKSMSTVQRTLVSLRGYFAYLVQFGVLQENPIEDVELTKVQKKKPVILSIEHIEQLLLQPDLSDAKGLRDKAIMELLYATGIRVSELILLEVQDVNLLLSYVRCKPKGTTFKERTIPIGAEAKTALEQYETLGRIQLVKEERQKCLFLNRRGEPLTRQGIWKLMKAYGVEAGIKEEVTPHSLRHSFAAHMIANGADVQTVQELMGHTDLASTQIYVQTEHPKTRQVYTNTHPRA
ncbi:tyrosine recombinase [Chakrabartyella piscis]|uniref:tyrosine recombinase n=1 Tax=Chakrabartyella piscis TaxID=2918914 RepID=UPI002958CD5A|nr:tyrosine recombinase [Chakrabartyella piscis]